MELANRGLIKAQKTYIMQVHKLKAKNKTTRGKVDGSGIRPPSTPECLAACPSVARSINISPWHCEANCDMSSVQPTRAFLILFLIRQTQYTHSHSHTHTHTHSRWLELPTSYLEIKRLTKCIAAGAFLILCYVMLPDKTNTQN